ncbi:hypothetical protein [Reyranella sp.]
MLAAVAKIERRLDGRRHRDAVGTQAVQDVLGIERSVIVVPKPLCRGC